MPGVGLGGIVKVSVLFLAVIIMMSRATFAEARPDTSALGGVLSNGDTLFVGYAFALDGGWVVESAEMRRRGFSLMSFTVERAGRRRVIVEIFDRRGMSLKEAARVIGTPRRLMRRSKVGDGYVLRRFHRAKKEMLLLPYGKDRRFLIGISTRKGDKAARKAGRVFMKHLVIMTSTLR